MQTITITVDLECHLSDGTTKTLSHFRLPIEADDEFNAIVKANRIAHEIVHDRGSDLLDAPLEYLNITKYH